MRKQIIITMAFLVVTGCNSAGNDIDSEQVREISRGIVDYQAEITKRTIDQGLKIWGSITPEQKQQAFEKAKKIAGEGVDGLSSLATKQ